MRMGVNVLVVIILGLTMFGAASYFLGSIVTNAQSSVDRLSAEQRQAMLDSFPRDQELYLPETSFQEEGGSVSIPYGVYNRYEGEITTEMEIDCGGCGATASSLQANVSPGDRRILEAVVTNESWSSGQHVFTLAVSNASGNPSLGTKTFYVES